MPMCCHVEEAAAQPGRQHVEVSRIEIPEILLLGFYKAAMEVTEHILSGGSLVGCSEGTPPLDPLIFFSME